MQSSPSKSAILLFESVRGWQPPSFTSIHASDPITQAYAASKFSGVVDLYIYIYENVTSNVAQMLCKNPLITTDARVLLLGERKSLCTYKVAR